MFTSKAGNFPQVFNTHAKSYNNVTTWSNIVNFLASKVVLSNNIKFLNIKYFSYNNDLIIADDKGLN